MKSILVVVGVCLVTLMPLSLSAQGAEKSSSAGTSYLNDSVQPIDLDGKLPEDFAWKDYFDRLDSSTYTDFQLAHNANKLMRARVDELCTQYRALMSKRGDAEAIAMFNEMQGHWEKLAEAEIRFVGSAWDGGSGAKVAYARHRFEVYLRRVNELRTLKAACLSLNE